jgi:hypothetical protein
LARRPGELKAVVDHRQWLADVLKNNITWIEKFGQMAIWLAGVLTTYAITVKISAITEAVTRRIRFLCHHQRRRGARDCL